MNTLTITKVRMSSIKIKVLQLKDWKIYKSLRLASLQDSPDSFGSTYKKEVEYSDEEWAIRLNSTSFKKLKLPLIAMLDGRAVGLAWGVHQVSDNSAINDSVVNVYQMWVAPEARGYGISKLLLNRIIVWTKELQVTAVCLEVTTTNMAALNLYQSNGFRIDGEPILLREGSSLLVQSMKLELDSVADKCC